MEGILTIAVFFGIVLLISFLSDKYKENKIAQEKELDRTTSMTSNLINELEELNERYKSKFYFHSDRESEFKRTNWQKFKSNSFWDILRNDIADNFDYYDTLFMHVYENKKNLPMYLKDCDELRKSSTYIYASEREKRLFEEHKLKPVIDPKFIVNVFYITRDNTTLKKSSEYNYNAIKLCFVQQLEELGKKTHIQKERARLGDRLRYEIMERDGFKCVKCGRTVDDGIKLHVDHIVPVSKGGRTIKSNLQTLCERCNLGKSNSYNGEAQYSINSMNELINKEYFKSEFGKDENGEYISEAIAEYFKENIYINQQILKNNEDTDEKQMLINNEKNFSNRIQKPVSELKEDISKNFLNSHINDEQINNLKDLNELLKIKEERIKNAESLYRLNIIKSEDMIKIKRHYNLLVNKLTNKNYPLELNNKKNVLLLSSVSGFDINKYNYDCTSSYENIKKNKGVCYKINITNLDCIKIDPMDSEITRFKIFENILCDIKIFKDINDNKMKFIQEQKNFIFDYNLSIAIDKNFIYITNKTYKKYLLNFKSEASAVSFYKKVLDIQNKETEREMLINKYKQQLKENEEIKNRNLRIALEDYLEPYCFKLCRLFYINTENTYPSGLEQKEYSVLVTGLMPLKNQFELRQKLLEEAINNAKEQNFMYGEELYTMKYNLFNNELPDIIADHCTVLGGEGISMPRRISFNCKIDYNDRTEIKTSEIIAPNINIYKYVFADNEEDLEFINQNIQLFKRKRYKLH